MQRLPQRQPSCGGRLQLLASTASLRALLAGVALVVSACGGGSDGGGTPPAPDAPVQQALIRTSAELPGARCPNGGTRAQAGHDANGNGVLDTGEETSTVYICADAGSAPGTATLVRTAAEAAGANCALGGTRVEAGMDDDADGALDPAEITTTTYVCHAAPSPYGNGLVRTAGEPAGANCTHGGTRIEAGLDANGNGALDNAEVQSTAYACNAAPPPYSVGLVRYRAEPAGITCALGGSRVEAGTDDNGNGVLDDAEVDSVAFICTASPPGTPFSWRGAQLMSAGSVGADHPRVAIAPNGNGLAAWVHHEGGLWTVRASRYDAAAVTWRPAQVLTVGSPDFVQQLEAALDPAGNAMIIWREDTATASTLWARRFRVAANTWDPAVQLETHATLDIGQPMLAMDASGNAIATWALGDMVSNGTIRARRFDVASGTWLPAVQLDDGTTATNPPQLAMEPGGEAIVVWEQAGASFTELRSARYLPATGTWAAPVAIPTGTQALLPYVAINASGRAVVTYVLPGLQTYASTSNAAGTAWNTAVALDGPGRQSLPFGALIDNFGNATAFRLDFIAGYVAARHDGATGTWTDLPGIAADWNGQLGIDGMGNIHAVFAQGGNVQARALPAGAGAWQAPVLLEIDSDTVLSGQRIAVAPDGKAIAAWIQQDAGGNVHMLVNTLR